MIGDLLKSRFCDLHGNDNKWQFFSQLLQKMTFAVISHRIVGRKIKMY